MARMDGAHAFDIYRGATELGHFKFASDDDTLSIFCHEGPWNVLNQRIWLLDLLFRQIEPCYRQGEDDTIGHEFWTQDGLVLYENRGKGQGRRWLHHLAMLVTWIVEQLKLRGKRGTTLCKA